ncbi:MAG: hypothetical protein ACRD0V_14385 [Acidimicrobiales bacterium]
MDNVVNLGHCLGGIERKARREDRKTTQNHLLLTVEKVVTPIEGGGQRLLPRDPAALTGEEPQAVVEPVE